MPRRALAVARPVDEDARRLPRVDRIKHRFGVHLADIVRELYRGLAAFDDQHRQLEGPKPLDAPLKALALPPAASDQVLDRLPLNPD